MPPTNSPCQKLIDVMLKGITSNGIEAYADLVNQIVQLIKKPDYTAYKDTDLGMALREVRRLLQTQNIPTPPMTQWEQSWEALQRSQQPAPQPTQSLPSAATTAVAQAVKPQVFVQQPIATPVQPPVAQKAAHPAPQAPVNSGGMQTARAGTSVMPPQSASLQREAQELNPTPVADASRLDCQRRGEAIVGLINRVKGSPKVEWKGYTLGPRVVVHRLALVDDGVSDLKMPSEANYAEWSEQLYHRAMVPKGAKVTFRSCYGYIAMEVPHDEWNPIPFLSNPWMREAVEQWKHHRPLPYDEFEIWCGVDEENKLFTLNLDSPATAAHTGIAGSTGGGKNGVASVIIYGSACRYEPNFVKFILVDPQEINFQFYKSFSPYLWGGLGILSDQDEITRVFGFSTSEEEKQGLIFAEAERRKKLFAKASVDNIRSYNRFAYKDYLRWCEKAGIHHLQLGALDRYNLEVILNPGIGLPILERILITIDEIAAVGSLYSNAKRSFDDWIRKICQELRKFGFHFVGMTQDPAADADGAYKSETRSQLGNRIGLFCNADEVSERAIGKGFAACTSLAGNGDSYVLKPGMSQPSRVQWFWISNEEVQKHGLLLSRHDNFSDARMLYSKQQQLLLQEAKGVITTTQDISFGLDTPQSALPSSPERTPAIALTEAEQKLWTLVQQKFVALMGLDSNNAILQVLFGSKDFRKLGELKTLLAKLSADPRAQQLYQKIESRRSK